jgi:hypothetical protein
MHSLVPLQRGGKTAMRTVARFKALHACTDMGLDCFSLQICL